MWQALAPLSDEQLVEKTAVFRQRLEAGETPDDLMHEAFAVVKEACRRLCGRSWSVVGHDTLWQMVPFDVQLMGAIVLHRGEIAEMATGEGRTLVATILTDYAPKVGGRHRHGDQRPMVRLRFTTRQGMQSEVAL